MRSVNHEVRRSGVVGSSGSRLLLLLGFLLISASPLGAVCLDLQLTDAEEETGVAYATVRVVDLDRAFRSDADGHLTVCGLSERPVRIVIEHIGYESTSLVATMSDAVDDTLRISVVLVPTAVETDTVIVIAGRHAEINPTAGSRVLSGSELQRNLGGSVAETIETITGVRTRSTGPGAAQATIRGVSSDRVVMLEEGRATGDASTLGADHALSIDPIGAERISVLRGPAALLFGSSPLGGVVDVRRIRPTESSTGRLTGVAGLTGSTNGPGGAGGFGLSYRATDDLAAELSASWRKVGSMASAVETIDNTDIETTSIRGGLAYRGEQIQIGLDGSFYDNDYGVPSPAESNHPDVRIAMRRRGLDGQIDWVPSNPEIPRFSLEFGGGSYAHSEIEPSGSIGTRYDIDTRIARLQVDHGTEESDDLGGSIAVGFESEEFSAFGLRIDPTTSLHLHGTLHEHLELGPVDLSAAVRVDHIDRSNGDPGEVPVERSFTGVSAALGAGYAPIDEVTVGIDVMRTYRAPDVIELFSRGPHAASFSYEVGNADLDAERAYAVELGTSIRTDPISLDLQGFLYTFDRYLIAVATGDTNRATFLPIYRFTDEPARLFGLDATVRGRLSDEIRLEGDLSWVRGDRTDLDVPLSEIPPLLIRPRVVWSPTDLHLSFGAEIRAAQNRTGLFESSTPGSTLFELAGQYRFRVGSTFHAVSLRIENLMDAEWFDHLSRLRTRFASGGRGVVVGWRVVM